MGGGRRGAHPVTPAASGLGSAWEQAVRAEPDLGGLGGAVVRADVVLHDPRMAGPVIRQDDVLMDVADDDHVGHGSPSGWPASSLPAEHGCSYDAAAHGAAAHWMTGSPRCQRAPAGGFFVCRAVRTARCACGIWHMGIP